MGAPRRRRHCIRRRNAPLPAKGRLRSSHAPARGMGPEPRRVRHGLVLRHLLRNTSLALALLSAWASTAQAQVGADTLQARDTAAVPDSLAAQAQEAAPPADTIFHNLPALDREVPEGFATGVWVWDHEAIMASGANTVAEVVADVPGLIVLLGGDYGTPARDQRVRHRRRRRAGAAGRLRGLSAGGGRARPSEDRPGRRLRGAPRALRQRAPRGAHVVPVRRRAAVLAGRGGHGPAQHERLPRNVRRPHRARRERRAGSGARRYARVRGRRRGQPHRDVVPLPAPPRRPRRPCVRVPPNGRRDPGERLRRPTRAGRTSPPGPAWRSPPGWWRRPTWASRRTT